MGLFDFFMSDEKKIQKKIRVLLDRDAQEEEREAAAFWLVENKSETALLGLLSRFDVKLDHQMKDQSEKDQLYQLALSVGADIHKPLRVWLRRCANFAQPMNLYRELVGDERWIEMGLELLRIEYDKDNSLKPEKKRGLLIWLAGHKHSRIFDEIPVFLEDFDENVRCAAAETLISQEDEQAREPLLNRLIDPEEDSNRLRKRLAEVFTNRRWSLSPHHEKLAENPPQGYKVENKRYTRN